MGGPRGKFLTVSLFRRPGAKFRVPVPFFAGTVTAQGRYFDYRMFSCQGTDPVPSAPRELETLVMTNDAKLGLIVGVFLVVTAAAMFFRQDPVAPSYPSGDNPAATALRPAGALGPRGQYRPVRALAAHRSEDVRSAGDQPSQNP
jgi:hypothetical protein